MTRDFGADLAACEKATPGPWRTAYANKTERFGPLVAATAPGHQVRADGHTGGTYPSCDLDFIAEARSALPAALGLIKRIHVYATMVAADSDSTEDERCLMLNIKFMIEDGYGETVK